MDLMDRIPSPTPLLLLTILGLLAAPGASVAAEAAGTGSRVVVGAPDAAESVQALLEQARFLMGKYRADLARLIVQKSLAVDAEDPRTVLMAADLALQAGQTEEAQALLAQLQRKHPNAPATRELQNLVRVYTIDRLQLRQLIKLADDGSRTDDARQLARRLFPDGRAPGLLSDQFGWLLTGRATARRPTPPDLATQARLRGYDALATRSHHRAESEFRAALKQRPSDAPALGGLGILRLRDGRYADAERYFNQAIAAETVDATEWRALAATARYWNLVSQGREQLNANEPARAAALLQSAVPLQPQQTEAKLLLADALAAQQRGDEAVLLYDQVLARDPKEARALRGRLAVRIARAHTVADHLAVLDEAQHTAQRLGLPAADLLNVGALRAAAQREADAGRVDAALQLLTRSMALQPTDAWLRHDLARLHQQQGRGALAQQIMDDGVQRAPGDADMRHAAALVAFGNEQEEVALAHLRAIPPAQRTPAHASLAQTAAFEAAMRRQRSALAQADVAGNEAALAQAREHLNGQVDRRLRVAAAELGAGRTARAQADLDALDPATLSAADALTWAELSADAGRDTAANGVLARLAPSSAGTPLQDRVIAAQARLAERRIERAVQAGHADEARRTAAYALQPWLARSPAPRSARLAQAELWLAAGEPAHALPLLDGLLADAAPGSPAPDMDIALLGVRTLAALGRQREATQQINALVAAYPRDARVRLEAARLARAAGDHNAAMAHLKAIALTDPALASSTVAPAAVLATTSPDPAVLAARNEIAAIEARRQPRVEVAYTTYSRAGTAGLSELRAREIPVAVTWPMDYNGHAFVRLDHVSLDAGTLVPGSNAADRFGTVFATNAFPPALTQPLRQQADGHNLGIGWEDDRRRVDIGLTGVGMPVTNVVGGWRQTFDTPTTDITLDVSRRPQTSSLLAYAGAVNPGPGVGTGDSWGGVTNTSASLRLGLALPRDYALASTLRLGVMDGRHVQRNPYWQWRTVVDRDWLRRDSLRLNVGVAGMLWQFQHNAGEYTWGHGGYYSPQRYASISLPVDLTGRRGAWSYQLRGAVTHSWTGTASAPYYPLDPSLQQQSVLGDPRYNGGRGGGLGTSLRGALEWQFAPRWVAGAGFDVERSSDYAPNRSTLYLRHFFKPQADALSVPPRPVVPYSQF